MDKIQKWIQGPTLGSDNPKKLHGKVSQRLLKIIDRESTSPVLKV